MNTSRAATAPCGCEAGVVTLVDGSRAVLVVRHCAVGATLDEAIDWRSGAVWPAGYTAYARHVDPAVVAYHRAALAVSASAASASNGGEA